MLVMSKVRGRYEVVKADPDKPRGRRNVANVKQDPKDKGKLGTRKLTGRNVSNVVGRSAKTGQVRSRPTNLSKFPKPRPIISPTPVGIAAALAPIAYEQTKNQQQAGSDSMGKTIATRMKDTARDIQGTPAEIAEDKKRAAAKKKKEAAAKKKREAAAKKKAAAKNKMPNAEVYVDSAVTYDMGNIPKAYGGKVIKRKKGKKVGRGCGAAMRGGGAVMKS